MTKRHAFHLQTEDPVIVTARSATSDQGEGLRFIPGATIWGVLAAEIYRKETSSPWDLLHSGQLKISNAYPVLDGKMAWPVPLSLHHEKAQSALVENAICLASSTWDVGGQPKQFRDGFLHADADRLQNPRMQDAIKTAINTETGAAAKAQIFASEAICAGQDFVFWVEGEDDDVDLAVSTLEGRCHLGRSRSAEFGKVRLNSISLYDLGQSEPTNPKKIEGKTAYIWLLSDLCLSDGCGQPLLDPSDFAPTIKGQVDWSRSFLRFRDYWPYNGKWQTRALERQVIAQGSVFCVENASGPLGLTWLGENNAQGDGLVFVSDGPPLEALGLLPSLRQAPRPIITNAKGTALSAWLRDQMMAKTDQENTIQDAEELASSIMRLLSDGKRHPANQTSGPSKTQIHELRRGLQQLPNAISQWMEKLWGQNPDEDPAWGFLVTGDEEDRLRPLHHWVTAQVLDKTPSELRALIKALDLVAKRLEVDGSGS